MQWSDVVAQLRRSSSLVQAEPHYCGLMLERDGRRQRVLVHRALRGAAMTISAQVCASRHISPLQALEYNGTSAPWALGLLNEAFILRRTLALASLSESDMDGEIDAIATEAARLHQLHVTATTEAQHELSAQLFSHWWTT
jgi:hypothetical protein